MIIPLFGLIALHAFWILPAILTHQNPLEQLGSAYSTTGAVKFFSFAALENALSLLHPNWPENLFGKTYFMKPEFLGLPILAYISLLFISTKEKTKEQKKTVQYVLYFALLALIAAFLAKGANDPFGEIYLWMFTNIPGFGVFRDSTKWYVLIAISYSLLIPFSLKHLQDIFKKKFLNP